MTWLFFFTSFLVNASVDNCKKAFQPLEGSAYSEKEQQKLVAAHSASSDVSLGKSHTSVQHLQYARWGLGNSKLCQSLNGYQYCTFGFEAGVCVPNQCSAEDLQDDSLIGSLLTTFRGASQSDVWVDCAGKNDIGGCSFSQVLLDYIGQIEAFHVLSDPHVCGQMTKETCNVLGCFPLGDDCVPAYGFQDEKVHCVSDFSHQSVDWGSLVVLVVLTHFIIVMPIIASIAAYINSDDSKIGGGRRQGIVAQMFLAANNFGRLLRQDRQRFFFLDGLMSLATLWIVLANATLIMIQLGGWSNNHDVLPGNDSMGSKWEWQVMYMSEYGIDTFLFIQGFVASWGFIKAFEAGLHRKEHFMKWWITSIIYRILRIIPTYLPALFIYWKVFPLLVEQPWLYRYQELVSKCDESWWENILFVNNILSQNRGCLPVSWYFGLDIQLYALAPFVVLVYHKHKAGGMMVNFGLMTLIVILSFTTAYDENMSLHRFDGKAFDRYETGALTYPWTRGNVFLLGQLLAFVWNQRELSNQPRFKIRKFFANLFVIFGIILTSLSVFGTTKWHQLHACPIDGEPSSECGSGLEMVYRAIFIAIRGPLWCTAILIFSILCFSNQGGFVQTVLSHPMWIIPARLCVGIYLFHFGLFYVFYLNRTFKASMDAFFFLLFVLAVLFLSAVFSGLLFVFIESPLSQLVNHILLKRSVPTEEKAPLQSTTKSPSKSSDEQRPRVINVYGNSDKPSRSSTFDDEEKLLASRVDAILNRSKQFPDTFQTIKLEDNATDADNNDKPLVMASDTEHHDSSQKPKMHAEPSRRILKPSRRTRKKKTIDNY